MLSKASLIACVAFASTIVLAAPHGSDNTGINNSCNTGPIQCCNQVVNSTPYELNKLQALLAIPMDLTGLIGQKGQVGANCTPQGVVSALNGNKCDAQTVCCEGNRFGGLISIGCSPINL